MANGDAIHNPGYDQAATIVVAASNSRDGGLAQRLCDGSNDNIQIQSAIDALPTVGGRVVLLEGNYVLAADLTLPDDVTFEGQGDNTILTFSGTAIANAITMDDNCKVKNMKIVIAAGAGAGGTRPNALYATGKTHMVVEGVWIVGDTTVTDDGSDSRQNGIYWISPTESKILNCHIDSCDRNGIRITTGNNCLISGNTTNSNTRVGISVESSSYCAISHNSVHDNQTGIFFAAGNRSTIVGNSVEGNSSVGIYLHTSWNVTVSGNNCYGDDTEIRVETSHANTITGNVCANSLSAGILIMRADYNTITGNTCYGNATDGIRLNGDGVRNSDYNVISSNVCYGNTDDGIEIAGGTDANRNTLIGNQVRTNTGTPIVDGGTNTIIKNNDGFPSGDHAVATIVVASSTSRHDENADYICDGTADNVQIQAAIDALPTAGGKILLLEGTYNCIVDIDLDGASQVLEGQGPSTIISFSAGAIVEGIHITGADVKVCNMKVVLVAGCGTGGARPNVVTIYGVDKVVLDSLWIVGDTSVADDGSDTRQNGVYIRTSNESRIVNCRIEDNDRAGIAIRNCLNGLISNNIIEGNTQQGIRSIDGCQHMTISGNSVLDNGQEGMFLYAFSFCTIAGNTVEGNTSVGIYLRGTINSTVSDNTCHLNGSTNIRVEGGGENVITGNQACGCADGHGILIYRSNYNVVSGNGCNDNGQDGISVLGDGTANADYNAIVGNVCTGNTDDGIDITGVGDCNKSEVIGNQCLGNGTALEDNGTGTDKAHNIVT